MRLMRLAGILLVASALGACDVDGELEEIERVASPDGVVDAVVIRKNFGATTSYAYQVYVVQTGAKPEEGKQNFVADRANGLTVKWEQTRSLAIVFSEARIFEFSNFWTSREVEEFRYVVELRLAPTSGSYSLGSESRNLQ